MKDGAGRRREGGGGEEEEQGQLYQGFLQALLVVAVELFCLPCGAHCPIQGLPQVHESGLMLGQLVSGVCDQRLVSLPGSGQLLLHTVQHWQGPV